MIFDIVIILVFAVCIIIGVKKGFAKTVLGLCSYIVSIVLGVLFFDLFKGAMYSYAPAANWIESFKQSISGTVEAYINRNPANIPTFLQTYINNVSGEFAAEVSNAVVDALVAVVFIILLILAVKIISEIICGLVKLPVLKQFNSALGGAVGAINGVIVCYVVGAVLLFSLTVANNGFFVKQLESSLLAAYFYKYNFILNILIGL